MNNNFGKLSTTTKRSSNRVMLRRKLLLFITLQLAMLIPINHLIAQCVQFVCAREGEVLKYWSPLHEFADSALLTRANGQSLIRFAVDQSGTIKHNACFRFLIGHSTGTSSGERDFDVMLNDQPLFVFHTVPQMTTGAMIQGEDKISGASYSFRCMAQDINKDAFGFLEIHLKTVPAGDLVFGIRGRQHESRDWLMVFMYREGWKLKVQPTSLVLRQNHRRMVQMIIDYPGPDHDKLTIRSRKGITHHVLRHGYQNFHLALYPENFKGKDTLQFFVNQRKTVHIPILINPVRPYRFHIIHHSHNDIGYSHLQEEVARIQSRNIMDAMAWIEAAARRGNRAYWHIESLWAVENFLSVCDSISKKRFFDHIRKGQISLSANYANILTGLCQPEEHGWTTEYARYIEQMSGCKIRNAMITDIPGVSYWALRSYTAQQLPFLSLGPNYVENLPDHGDRVGGIIRETGDHLFFWKPQPDAADSILVWTAGKGYSYFHNIPDKDRGFRWEKKISDYATELSAASYPMEDIQLRYTKNADNGPVDTTLDIFVKKWNQKYSSPQLQISNLDSLYVLVIRKYRVKIPVISGGEIAPYWEDGAYSTAREEILNREISRKIISAERRLRKISRYDSASWYPLHRDIIMFHEHTWGSWCSISDPEIPFTTRQWAYKKSFLDSAEVRYKRLMQGIIVDDDETENSMVKNAIPLEMKIDSVHGGIHLFSADGNSFEANGNEYLPFELIYSEGTNSVLRIGLKIQDVQLVHEDELHKEWIVMGSMDYFPKVLIRYILDKKINLLTARFNIHKSIQRNKESLHIALPFRCNQLEYGSDDTWLQYPQSLLQGSNYEFVCTPGFIRIHQDDHSIHIRTSGLALAETNGIIDESQIRGAKVWKQEAATAPNLFLYVLNNFWHTNFKAYQDGEINFAVQLWVEQN